MGVCFAEICCTAALKPQASVSVMRNRTASHPLGQGLLLPSVEAPLSSNGPLIYFAFSLLKSLLRCSDIFSAL